MYDTHDPWLLTSMSGRNLLGSVYARTRLHLALDIVCHHPSMLNTGKGIHCMQLLSIITLGVILITRMS